MQFFYHYSSCFILLFFSTVATGSVLDNTKADQHFYDNSQKKGFYWYDDKIIELPVEKTEEAVKLFKEVEELLNKML